MNSTQPPPDMFGSIRIPDTEIKRFDQIGDLFQKLRDREIADWTIDELEHWEKDLRTIFPEYRMLGTVRDHSHVWHRGRVAKGPDEFSSLRQLIYRTDADAVPFGRANYPKQPVFYAGWNEPTVYSELTLKKGDFIYLIRVRPWEGKQIRCAVMGEYSQIDFRGGSLVGNAANEREVDQRAASQPLLNTINSIVDDYVAYEFARVVEPADIAQYKFSAMFAQRVLSAENSGFIYPSIQRRAGVNLAITPALFDSSFEVLTVEVHEVLRDYGRGHLILRLVKRSCDFSPDGTINFPGKRVIKALHSRERGFVVEAGTKGWRIPADAPTNRSSEASAKP